MKATRKQVELCNALIVGGAPFELKHPHEDSVKAADEFIKTNYHYLRSSPTKMQGYYDRCLENDSFGLRPEDLNVPNM
ncbi:conserved hypothetical protein [Vibrio phage 424E50-1]|nr:conserved hypothetical protein [Vibrio phage 424E50-1]